MCLSEQLRRLETLGTIETVPPTIIAKYHQVQNFSAISTYKYFKSNVRLRVPAAANFISVSVIFHDISNFFYHT